MLAIAPRNKLENMACPPITGISPLCIFRPPGESTRPTRNAIGLYTEHQCNAYEKAYRKKYSVGCSSESEHPRAAPDRTLILGQNPDQKTRIPFAGRVGGRDTT